jgi:excinuclease UvrABC nuclease subunit
MVMVVVNQSVLVDEESNATMKHSIPLLYFKSLQPSFMADTKQPEQPPLLARSQKRTHARNTTDADSEPQSKRPRHEASPQPPPPPSKTKHHKVVLPKRGTKDTSLIMAQANQPIDIEQQQQQQQERLTDALQQWLAVLQAERTTHCDRLTHVLVVRSTNEYVILRAKDSRTGFGYCKKGGFEMLYAEDVLYVARPACCLRCTVLIDCLID